VNSDYTIYVSGAVFFSLYLVVANLIEFRRRRKDARNGSKEQFLVRSNDSRKDPPR